jgi:RNA polymerase sigma-70 factor (ECF subfamily)
MDADRATRTDGELLRRAPLDSADFEELYRRHEAIVTTFVARRARNAELTADLVAETFATALLKADRFRDDGDSAVGWLLGIARNHLLFALRKGRADVKARRRLGAEPVTSSDGALERVEELIDAQAAGPHLRRALEALPQNQREAVEAYVLDEHSYTEAATDLGIPQAAVRKRVSRGLARLRILLDAPQSATRRP